MKYFHFLVSDLLRIHMNELTYCHGCFLHVLCIHEFLIFLCDFVLSLHAF